MELFLSNLSQKNCLFVINYQNKQKKNIFCLIFHTLRAINAKIPSFALMTLHVWKSAKNGQSFIVVKSKIQIKGKNVPSLHQGQES